MGHRNVTSGRNSEILILNMVLNIYINVLRIDDKLEGVIHRAVCNGVFLR
jgi:hypothetical protein